MNQIHIYIFLILYIYIYIYIYIYVYFKPLIRENIFKFVFFYTISYNSSFYTHNVSRRYKDHM